MSVISTYPESLTSVDKIQASMDNNKSGKLDDELLPAFIDHSDFHPSIDRNWCMIPQDGPFDSSSSSSSASCDGVYTPSSSDSLGFTDIDGFSGLSLGSNGSISSVCYQAPYNPIYMENWAKDELERQRNSGPSPPDKVVKGHFFWNCYDSYGNDMYDALGLQDDFSDLPGIMLNSPPELLFDNTSSPMLITPSPNNFVVPSQTFKSEPYRPTTPKTPERDIADSSPKRCCQQDEAIKYFMSPREPQLPTPSSSPSSGSPNTAAGRKPLSKPLQSSVSLHRIQSAGSSRIIKPVKRTSPSTSKIDCVAAGTFRCNYPGCKSVHGFKRHEHLKRHQRTHEAQVFVLCDFCPKKFPLFRFDNFKSHVILHSENKPGSRTKYCAGATQVVESWKKRKEEVDTKLEVAKEMFNYRPWTAHRHKAGSKKSRS